MHVHVQVTKTLPSISMCRVHACVHVQATKAPPRLVCAACIHVHVHVQASVTKERSTTKKDETAQHSLACWCQVVEELKGAHIIRIEEACLVIVGTVCGLRLCQQSLHIPSHARVAV